MQTKQNNTNNKDKLSIILLVHNEENLIAQTLNDIYSEFYNKITFEIIVIEDGSQDKTLEILNGLKDKLDLKIFSQKERAGYSAAIKRSTKYPIYDWVLLLDSDNQYDPKDFWKLWEYKDTHDIILGKKIGRKDNPFRKILSKCFNLYIRTLFTLEYRDIDTGFRLIRKDIFIKLAKEVIYNNTFTAEFVIRAHNQACRVIEVPIGHRKRLLGNSNIFKPTKIPKIVLGEIVGFLKLYIDLKILKK